MRFVLPVLLLATVGTRVPAVGPPPGPPPRTEDPSPPPAWIETRTTSRWLAYGSYCWSAPPDASGSARGLCADMVPPGLRTDLPVLTVRPGARLRVHLAFVPTEVSLVSRGAETDLKPASTVRLRARRRGPYVLDLAAKGPSGDASYLARIRVAGP